MIDSFRGKYYFLSNFYPSNVLWNGVAYNNNEAAFQSAKTKDETKRAEFANLDPRMAKRKGRHIQLRGDWEKIKYDIMYQIVLAKFSQNKELKEKLIATKNETLIEGNTWGDRIWGKCNGSGKNHLGKILMQVREELK